MAENIKTIIIVSDFGFVNGGNAKVALSTALGLSKVGYRVILFCGANPIDDSILNANIEVVCLNQKDILNNTNRIQAMINGIWNFKAKKEFEKLISGLDIDSTIVHYHSWSKILSASILTVTNKYKVKCFVTVHDYFSFCPNGGFFDYKQKKICNLQSMSMKCVKCNCDSRKYIYKIWRLARQFVQDKVIWKNENVTYITISKLNDKIAKQYLPPNIKTFLVKNPIELSNENVVDIQNNDEYIFIGRLSAEKGVITFCEAISQLGLKAKVLGDGDLKYELEYLYPNIDFVGWVSGKEKEKYIIKAKALIFPSIWYEGAPLTIMEMKNYGIPCIVSDASSAVEEIENGKNGYVFSSGNIEDLKKQILKFEASDKKKLQENILNSIDKDFYSLDSYISRLLTVYGI